MFTMKCLSLALLITGIAVEAHAMELKVATWNLNWLTTRPTGSHGLPPDVKSRDQADWDRLRQYALELDADLVAIEEVDGRQAAVKVFPAEKYSVHMTHDHVTQRTGLAVKRGLHYDINPDVTALAPNPEARLRSGADITLHLASGSLRVLAVHLKTGCQAQPLANSTKRSCIELAEQVPPLQSWIAARTTEKMPFLVLGDFNRDMDGRDPFFAALRQAAPLSRATEGKSSPCWGAESFIDHILAGGAAISWMRVDTLRVLRYRETEPEWKSRLSDHCPVSVRLVVPDGAG